jgi:competence protein ComEC
MQSIIILKAAIVPMLPVIPLWKRAPFLRLLLPLIAGIILQWYFQYDWQQIVVAGFCFAIAFFLFQLLPLAVRFKWQAIQGIILNLILIVIGTLLTYQKDIRHQKTWYGNIYHNRDYMVVTINEPLSEKAKSYKAESIVNNFIQNNTVRNCKGKLLLYFEKDSTASGLKYGDRILVSKNLQPIKNSGNPGAFDYKRYSAFQQIFHQVYLKENDWILLKGKNVNTFNQFIYSARDYIIKVLQKTIHGKNELGIAEALLIGYKADLDTDLVQAYSNTGVVHIIAISGLHLGLIYVTLLWIFNRIPFLKRARIFKALLVLISLWLFAFLTGASASVLRSAVMFSCIIGGEIFSRKASIYNSLAASAFILLFWNPYFLWDVGFQLSYLAVVGIIIFQKPIYNWVYIKNKHIDKIWKLLAISLAAQIFTFPICLYYFHQFPNLFLISNLIAVPLSSIILYGEIFLVAFASIPLVGEYTGEITWGLIWLMNKIIVGINQMPYAVYDGISASLFSTMVLYCFVICVAVWLLNKNKMAFVFSLFALLVLTGLNAWVKWIVTNQQKIIVYNIPQHQAVDFVSANNYTFFGDSILTQDGMLQNFHIKPGRIAMHLQFKKDSLIQLFQENYLFNYCDKRIVVIDSSSFFEPLQQKINVDLIIISKNPKVYIPDLAKVFNCKQFIFDASNSLWKIAKWQKDCEQLHLQSWSVPENGAFIMDL